MHAQSKMKNGIRLETGPKLHLVIDDDYVSYTNTRDKHWNITGPESRHLHQKLQAQFAKTNRMLRTFLSDESQQQNFPKQPTIPSLP